MSRAILRVVKGPAEHHSYELELGEYLIGRDNRCEVVLPDETVSRVHAKIILEEEEASIYDCGSRNGVIVNGERTLEAKLTNGDIIELGTSVLCFELPEDTSIPFKIEESNSTHERIVEPAVRPSDRKALETLFEVSQIITSTLALPELLNKLVDAILSVFDADRGAILLRDEVSGELHPGIAKKKSPQFSADALAVSRTIIKEVLEEGVGVLASDALQDERFDSSASVEAYGIRSAMCVPIGTRGKILGIIYVDSCASSGLYTEEDLRLLGSIASQAAAAIENARLHEELRREILNLRTVLGERSTIIGNSKRMQELLDIVRRASQTDSTVLLRGESGTGKELVARMIHQASPRAEKPFVTVCCAAIPETLLESELFGHEKGAFTGATSLRKGKFELAHGGTVFLDEISEMPLKLQAKLLRALESKEIDRVGSSKSIRVDTRIIASTNRDLETAIRRGEFRQDLYYRLSVIEITLPPLRERKEDIPELTEYFLRMISEDMGRRPPRVSEEAMQVLLSHDWKGNVRELRNAIERAMVLGVEDLLLPSHLPPYLQRRIPQEEDQPEQLSEVEKHHIENVLRRTGWNKSKSAEILGISRPRLNRKIRQYNLKP